MKRLVRGSFWGRSPWLIGHFWCRGGFSHSTLDGSYDQKVIEENGVLLLFDPKDKISYSSFSSDWTNLSPFTKDKISQIDVSLEMWFWFFPYQICLLWIPALLLQHVLLGRGESFVASYLCVIAPDIYFNWFHLHWEHVMIWPGVNSKMTWLDLGLL